MVTASRGCSSHPRPSQGPEPNMMKKRRPIAAMAASALVVALLGVVRLSRPSTPAQHPEPSATSIDLGTKRTAGGAAIGDGAMWILASGGGVPKAVERVDPVSLRVTRTFSLGFHARFGARGIAVGEGEVWVSVARRRNGHWDRLRGELLRIDEQTGRIRTSLIPPDPGELTLAFGSLWLAEGRRSIARIDPHSGQVIEEVPLAKGVALPDGIVAGFGSLWVEDSYRSGSLLRVDSHTGSVEAHIHDVTSVAAGASGMWVTR